MSGSEGWPQKAQKAHKALWTWWTWWTARWALRREVGYAGLGASGGLVLGSDREASGAGLAGCLGSVGGDGRAVRAVCDAPHPVPLPRGGEGEEGFDPLIRPGTPVVRGFWEALAVRDAARARGFEVSVEVCGGRHVALIRFGEESASVSVYGEWAVIEVACGRTRLRSEPTEAHRANPERLARAAVLAAWSAARMGRRN